MGTRHLIAVYLDGVHKVAQYGQWDGYPGGAGSDVLNFLRGITSDPSLEEQFKANVRSCTWIEEALKDPRVPALLQKWLHKNHSTCMWVLEYGVPQTKMEAKWITSNLGRYIRSKPHWEVKVRKTPVILREEPRGPLCAPFVPRRADIQEFLDRLEEASSAPKEIPSPLWEEQEARTLTEWVYKASLPEDYSPQGFRLHDVFRKPQKTRRNPEFHPEWKSSLVEFLDQYQGPDFYGFVRKNGIGKF